MRVENLTKTRVWEDLSLCQETSTKNAFKNSISDLGTALGSKMNGKQLDKKWDYTR